MDRTFKGLIAGSVGAIPMNVINLILYTAKLTELRFIDWAAIILTGDLPRDLNGIIYSLIHQIFWSGTLGIGLAFLIPIIYSRGYILKAILYSFLMSFILRGVVVLFKVHNLYKISFLSSEMNFIAIIAWAITTGYMLSFLDHKTSHISGKK